MDKSFKRMDSMVKHCGPLERRFPLLPQVESIGWLPHKTQRITHVFPGCNFSFVLAGRGTYFLRGNRYRVEAPCVLLQWPGEPMDYGPETEWTELYLIYPAECRAALEHSGAFDPENPVRAFQPAKDFSRTLEQVLTEILEPENAPAADRADLLCWEMIELSFILPDGVPEPDFLRRIRARLESPDGEFFDMAKAAAENGMSLSTLRRRWSEHYGSQTFTDIRNAFFLRESRRLLIETKLQMKEAAEKLGFRDPYYFSRKFHRLSGETPTQYRKKHKSP